MRKSLTVKVFSVLAVVIVLAHVSPVATALELCIGDGTDPNCCSKPQFAQPGAAETPRLSDGADCDCCITVDAAPSMAGATSEKASLDLFSGTGVPRAALSPTGPRITGLDDDDPGDSRLSSLRTIVLLI